MKLYRHEQDALSDDEIAQLDEQYAEDERWHDEIRSELRAPPAGRLEVFDLIDLVQQDELAALRQRLDIGNRVFHAVYGDTP